MRSAQPGVTSTTCCVPSPDDSERSPGAGQPERFPGQIRPTDFVVVTTPEAPCVIGRIAPTDGSLDYFYSLKIAEVK
jgi:hypothetical protein